MKVKVESEKVGLKLNIQKMNREELPALGGERRRGEQGLGGGRGALAHGESVLAALQIGRAHV